MIQAQDVKIKHDHLVAEKQRVVVKILDTLLADESVLYTKLRNYHWNATGIGFFALYEAIANQLSEIAIVIDEVAEHIRQYGANAPGTMEEFIRGAHLRESPGVYPDVQTMVANLVSDHGVTISSLQEDIETISEVSGDVEAIDLLTYLLQRHQKMAGNLQTCTED